MIKIKVSYERTDELIEVLKLLGPKIVGYKVKKGNTGRFRKAYIELR